MTGNLQSARSSLIAAGNPLDLSQFEAAGASLVNFAAAVGNFGANLNFNFSRIAQAQGLGGVLVSLISRATVSAPSGRSLPALSVVEWALLL